MPADIAPTDLLDPAPDAMRAAWAALARALTAVSAEASEAGDEAASDRAIAYRKHLAQVRDRWFSGEASPTRTPGCEGGPVVSATLAPIDDPRPVPRARLAQPAPDLADTLRHTIVGMVRAERPDLSDRQLGVLLTCYLTEGPHTVRGLAATLNVSKPAITRALDRLGELDFARRKIDPMDRRSVLVQRTLKGAAFLRELRGLLSAAQAAAEAG